MHTDLGSDISNIKDVYLEGWKTVLMLWPDLYLKVALVPYETEGQ